MQLSDIRPLHGSEHCSVAGGCVLRERRFEGSFGQPNQTIAVRRKLWRFGMGLEAIEHVYDLLALVGSKSGYIDQRLHPFGACESYDRAGIGVSRYRRSALVFCLSCG